MPRTLKMERLHYLGKFRNLKFIDEINDLPDNIAFNGELISALRVQRKKCRRVFSSCN
jgi:hypothetical protein